MGLSFFERMNGRLVDAAGVGYLVDFDLKVEATHFGALLRTGCSRISGIVRVRSWASDVVAEGTLTISSKERTLRYVLDFVADDGRHLRLWGQKDFNWRHPLASMTLMKTRLLEVGAGPDSEALATGTMRFDANDTLAFVGSFSPSSSILHRDLARPARQGLPSPSVVNAHEEKTLYALAEAMIVPGEKVPAVDSSTITRLREIFACFPSSIRSLYRTGLRALDSASRIRTGHRFVDLDLDARVGVLDGLDKVGASPIIGSLWVVIALAHFGRPDYLEAVGIEEPPPPAPEKPPRYMANVMAPDDLDAVTELPCDVVVIGSGAGGGPVAARLAERGLAVAVVEEGQYLQRRDFARAPEWRMLDLWRGRGVNFAIGNGIVTVPAGRAVGGTTTINSGTCLRPPDRILQGWRSQGFPADFDPAAFGPWLDAVAEELEVGKAQADWIGQIGSVVARGAEALKADGHPVKHGPLLRNAPGCDGQGVCVFGCPTDARRSSNVSWIPRALRAGANVFPGMRTTRILVRGTRAVGIEAIGQDAAGARRTLRLKARAVVVAGGALSSPRLLFDNGLRLPRLGKGLSIHPATGALAMFDESLGKPWRAIPQGYEVSGLVDERVHYEGSSAPPQFAASILPMRGAELTRWMDHWDQVGHFGFMVCDSNKGSVGRGPGGGLMVRYDIEPDVLDLLTRGTAMLAELLLRGGADEVATGIKGVPTIKSLDAARALASRKLKPRQFRVMGFHPLGTCAMGASPEEGVVDFDHRVFGTQGLYVIDGSSVPTSLGVNPQMTIMAMALRAADRLADALD